jgi:hypothetical protein
LPNSLKFDDPKRPHSLKVVDCEQPGGLHSGIFASFTTIKDPSKYTVFPSMSLGVKPEAIPAFSTEGDQ